MANMRVAPMAMNMICFCTSWAERGSAREWAQMLTNPSAERTTTATSTGQLVAMASCFQILFIQLGQNRPAGRGVGDDDPDDVAGLIAGAFGGDEGGVDALVVIVAEDEAENLRARGGSGLFKLDNGGGNGRAGFPGLENAETIDEGDGQEEQHGGQEEQCDHGVFQPGNFDAVGPVGGMFGIDVEGDSHAGSAGFA